MKALVGKTVKHNPKLTAINYQGEAVGAGFFMRQAMLNKINHTQVSNDFIDNWMKKLSAPAAKVFLAISRKTIGWHKDVDVISQGQLVELCGLSINTIKIALKELKQYKLITVKRTGAGKGIKTYFEINYISNPNISNTDILDADFVSGIDTLDLGIVSRIDTTKESNINKEYKDTGVIDTEDYTEFKKPRKRSRFIKPTFEEVTAHLKEKNITNFTAEEFIAHYESNGWMVGKVPMKSWKGAVITWTKNNFNKNSQEPFEQKYKRWMSK